jgi:ABC-2 type transport system permease protein
LQGIVAYLQLSAKAGSPLPAVGFAVGVAMLALHLVFYVTLAVMLGTLFEQRGPVIGLPLALLLGAQFWQTALPFLNAIAPWTLILPVGETQMALAMVAMQGQPLPTLVPIIATALWCVIFTGVAIWRFEREEF